MNELTTVLKEPRAASRPTAPAASGVPVAAQRSLGRTLQRQAGVVLPPVLVLIATVLFWQFFITWRHVPKYLVPSPTAVWQRFRVDHGQLWEAFRSTSSSALIGFLAAIVVGFLIAMLFASSRVVQRCLYPFAIILQTVPILAIAPLIIVWEGPGKNAIILITFIITVFPIIANSTIGLMSTDHNLVNLFAINNASRFQQLWKLRIPSAMPYVVTGLKISAGLSVIGAIVGEFFAGRGGASSGLGSLITFSSARLQTDMLFAAALTSSALGIGFFLIVNQLGNYAVRNWHESAITHEN
jgi:NitT/TauT family transport system permease protein